MRLSSQVSSSFSFFVIPTPDLCALHAFAPLVLHQLIIALLIGSHLFLFSIIFIFFLPFFCAKQKQVYCLLRERQQRGMCRDYQSVIFFLFLSFLFSRFCLLSSTITKSVGLTRPALDFPLEKPSIASTADKAEGYASPSSGCGSERESERETLLFKHSKCEFQQTHPVPVPVPIPIPIPVPFFARL